MTKGHAIITVRRLAEDMRYFVVFTRISRQLGEEQGKTGAKLV